MPSEPPSEPPAGSAHSASGLDLSQIAPQDLAEIDALFTPKFLQWEAPAAVLRPIDLSRDPRFRSELQLASLTPGLSPPRTLKIKVLPLPNRIHPRHMPLELRRPQFHRGLGPVLRQPIRRQRLGLSQLPIPLQEALLRALFKKYGEASHDLHIQGIFAHVPPELAPGLRISRDGREAALQMPAGFDARRATAGHYLVVLTTNSGETRRVLFRL